MNRADAARARAAELIERATATLAAPRPDGPAWQVPTPPAAHEAERKPPAAAAVTPAVAAGVSRAVFHKTLANYEEALARLLGTMLGAERNSWRMRATEAERRIADLEARLAKLEGKQ